MIPLTLEEVALACGGTLLDGEPGAVVDEVTTDSRDVRRGQLFVGLRGERFDGDAYAAQALDGGAVAAVVRPETAADLRGRPRIAVHDGVVALGLLGRAVRRRSAARVVAITGSAGKTTTKDILAALLRPVCEVVATRANLNNEVGLPLTLLEITPHTDVVVAELAMRGPGQIRELARLALPDIAVITTIAPVHLEFVGTLEADVHFVDVEPRDGGTHVLADAFTRRAALDFNFSGAHYLHDAQAALAAFVELGFRLDEARQGAARVEFSGLRGETVELEDGGLLLNDAYNANPLATQAALEHLVDLAGGRETVAVLGDMYELGPGAAAYHGAVGEHAARLGVRVVAVGDLARHYLTGAPGERWIPTVEECLAKLGEVVPPGATVLVKASRALRLERVAEAIRAAASASAAGEAAGAQNGEPDETPAGDPSETGDGRATDDGEEAGDA